MKRVKKYFMLVLVIVIAGTAVMPKENILAKKKSTITEYYAIYNGEKTAIKKVKIKKNRIVVWGSCERYKFKEGEDIWDGEKRRFPKEPEEQKTMKYKKRTFKLSKNVKYLGYGSDYGPDKYTKKEFKETVGHGPCYLGFGVKIKKGKVIEVFAAS